MQVTERSVRHSADGGASRETSDIVVSFCDVQDSTTRDCGVTWTISTTATTGVQLTVT